MTPVFTNKIPVLRDWDAPMDFGKSWRSHRIFGPNKRWRGLLSGIVTSALTGYLLQIYLWNGIAWPIDSIAFGPVLGAFLGTGALVGDAVESFFKRQRGIASGKTWFPFDQTDYIVGGLVFAVPFGVLPIWLTAWVLLLFFGLHLLSTYIGFKLGLKDQPI